MRIHYFQHVPFEGLGSIDHWAHDRNHSITVTRMFAGDAFPAPDTYDMLIVMGGPMGANDDRLFSWMVQEKKTIAAAIERGTPLLGICLGAQIIASVLGGRVYKNEHKEIGWFDLELTAEGQASPFFAGQPEKFPVFHWHGDTYDIPAGAQLLASSKACRNQAYSYRRHVLGLQFHLEMTDDSISRIVENCADELIPGPYVQDAKTILSGHGRVAALNSVMASILDHLAAVQGAPGQ